MDAVMQELAKLLRARYGDRLRQVLFFGSRARGDSSPESDYDCLLVFDSVDSNLQASMDRLASQWLMERGVVLSLFPLGEGELERFRFEPFLQNIRREGIAA